MVQIVGDFQLYKQLCDMFRPHLALKRKTASLSDI